MWFNAMYTWNNSRSYIYLHVHEACQCLIFLNFQECKKFLLLKCHEEHKYHMTDCFSLVLVSRLHKWWCILWKNAEKPLVPFIINHHIYGAPIHKRTDWKKNAMPHCAGPQHWEQTRSVTQIEPSWQTAAERAHILPLMVQITHWGSQATLNKC